MLLWPTWLSYAVSYLFHRHRLDQSPLSLALCRGGNASLIVVQFRASVWLPLSTAWMAVSELAPQRCLCSGFLSGERDFTFFYLGAY